MANKKMTLDKRKKIAALLSKVLLAVSTLLCVILLIVYIIEPDCCAAVTFWPIWIWAIPGIALALIAASTNKKAGLAITLVWLLLVIVIAEEPLAVLRSCTLPKKDCKSSCPSGNCLRVISLNCAGGNINATKELLPLSPDIVLLQESPPTKDLEILAQKLFADKGGFVLEGDTAVLARGRVIKTDVGKECCPFMTSTRVYLPSGLEVETISVHLVPPATAVNLLSPACWREHSRDRHLRLNKIAAINEHLDSITQNVPIVVGGDFNAKPWRRAIKAFSPQLNDSFKQAGYGWPGTGPSNLPLWRVDQIWVSKHFKPVKVWSEPNKNSDHRIVICDLCEP